LFLLHHQTKYTDISGTTVPIFKVAMNFYSEDRHSGAQNISLPCLIK